MYFSRLVRLRCIVRTAMRNKCKWLEWFLVGVVCLAGIQHLLTLTMSLNPSWNVADNVPCSLSHNKRKHNLIHHEHSIDDARYRLPDG